MPGAGDGYLRTAVLMDTHVTIQVVGHGSNPQQECERDEMVARAFEWVRRVEGCCTRFDPSSELARLTTQIGTAVPVSDLLFEAIRFAVAVAEETSGAFDPTIGWSMEARGFNREYRTGQIVRHEQEQENAVSYRDIRLDPALKTVTVLRPLGLDLGAVAKGLAVDMAARELAPLENYAVDAGGDLYAAGCNQDGAAWSVGIRHPRRSDELIETLQISNMAVCTSGDYERKSGNADSAHHILDPRTRATAGAAASVSVVAPTAMAADALATAAFVLGPTAGIRLLERHGVKGLIVSPTLERFWTGDNAE
jgi:thiamine biosynthesis lipoprotein